jgi:hypothetical protein
MALSSPRAPGWHQKQITCQVADELADNVRYMLDDDEMGEIWAARLEKTLRADSLRIVPVALATGTIDLV